MNEDYNQDGYENKPDEQFIGDLGSKNNNKKKNKNDNSGLSIPSGLFSDLEKLANGYNRYKAGGLSNVAKGYAKDKINDKINEKKDAAKDKIKNKVNDKLPESVRKQKDALAAKKNTVSDKLNKVKNAPDQVKRKLNEKAFKKGAKIALNGAGVPVPETVVEKLFKTSKGKPALEAARNARNPLDAIKQGTKKLLEIILKEQVKKKILAYVAPFVGVLAGILLIYLAISGVFHFNTYSYAENDGNTAEIDENYQKFYENVNKVGSNEKNRLMIIAVLTADKDVDFYICSDEEVSNGECKADEENDEEETDEDDDSGESYLDINPSKLKSYMKKINSKLNVDNNYEEGDYSDPENTGGELFKWLYKTFVERYYSEYFDTLKSKEDINKKKKEIIEDIYLYYKDLLQNVQGDTCSNTYYNVSCPNVIVDGTTYELEDYVAGVVKKEIGGYHEPEVLKAFAVAARSFVIASGKCGQKVDNSQNFQTFSEVDESNSNDKIYIEAAQATAGQVLLKKNDKVLKAAYVTVPVSKYITKNGDTWVFDMLHDADDENSNYSYSMSYSEMLKIAFGSIYYPSESSGHHWGMLAYGAVYEARQGKKYDEILKIFYGDDVALADTAESKSGSENSCGGNADGLFRNPDGFVSRLGRPENDNPFYYLQDRSNFGTTNEGECVWYANARAKEILAELKNGASWKPGSANGGEFCDPGHNNKNDFYVSTDYTKPQAGAIVSWKSGEYGHVAIVEKVEGNKVTISQSGLSFGPKQMIPCSTRKCIANNYGYSSAKRQEYCRIMDGTYDENGKSRLDGKGCFNTTTIPISSMATYSGKFQCYIYLAQPKNSIERKST